MMNFKTAIAHSELTNADLLDFHLYLAIINCDTSKVRQLVQQQGDLINLNCKKEKALNIAIGTHNLDMVNLLLELGAETDALDANNNTALHLACAKSKNVAIAEALISYEFSTKHKINIEAKNNAGQTALELAIISDNLEMVNLLLKFGAKTDVVGPNDNTALHCAVLCNASIRLAKQHRKHIDLDYRKESDLNIATEVKYLKMVNLLLEFGAKIDGLNAYNNTALHCAVLYNASIEIAKILVVHDADIEAINIANSTPLDIARQSGNTPYICLFVDKILDLGTSNDDNLYNCDVAGDCL